MTINVMDYISEAIAFGIDSFILAVCFRQYLKNKHAVLLLQDIPFLEINKELENIVSTSPEKKISYVAIRGTVRPLGDPIQCINNPKIVGVVQKLSIKEHVIQRSTAGFWSANERTIQEVYNAMPFILEDNNAQVEVPDALSADIIDLDVIADNFEPAIPSVIDHIWGFFSGVRQRGLQSTEEMLRSGTLLTGIGELSHSHGGKMIRLQSPRNGKAPFYLTTMPVTSLIRKLDERRNGFRWLCIFFGAIGIFIGSLMVHKYWRERKRKLIEEHVKRTLETTRRERRIKARESNLGEISLCVVCKENPKEMILLPCGHVCLCEDCALDIKSSCPVCRSHIENKSPAYMS